MSSKPLMVSSEIDDDFGFTFADSDEIVETAIEPHLEETKVLTLRLQQMYDAIMPLLANLSANPQQEYIKGPDRSKKIKAFKTKLDNLGKGYIQTRDL